MKGVKGAAILAQATVVGGNTTGQTSSGTGGAGTSLGAGAASAGGLFDDDEGAVLLWGHEEPVELVGSADSPWLVEGGGFTVQQFQQWLRIESQPWVSGGNLTRRETVAGYLALQKMFDLSNNAAVAFLRFTDFVVGTAAAPDARLPGTWRDVEQLLMDLIIKGEKWCVTRHFQVMLVCKRLIVRIGL